jgi:predicted small secreted protein
MKKLWIFLFSLFLVSALMASCSTRREVTRDVTYDARTGEPVRVERETTTTTDTT